MKKTTIIFKPVVLLGLVAMLTASCEDWLTIYPQDRVVEENFWEDKSDLEGVRYAAYRSMGNSISKFLIWGDLRSDAFVLNPSEPTSSDVRDKRDKFYKKLVQAMPDSSMTEFDWGSVYTTINFCNKVLQHGPEVLERDKQFTTTEWNQMHAEMVALRALNYFYLLRAFKDVPYSKQVVNTDSELLYLGLTNQLQVLDSCIVDIEGNPNDPKTGILGQARNRFPKKADTKGLITNSAIYVMLADMYLWRASLHEGRYGKNPHEKNKMIIGADTIYHDRLTDYNKAIEYADMALEALKKQNEEESKGYGAATVLTVSYGLPNCDLISNDFKKSKLEQDGELTFPVYENMFTNGNSRESIFELQFSVGDNTKNTIVNDLFTKGENNQFAVSEEAIKAIYKSENYMEMDTRVICGAFKRVFEKSESGKYPFSSQLSTGRYCNKYASPVGYINRESSENIQMGCVYKSDDRKNFIIYRMSDAMLIKAEAFACIGGTDAKKAEDYCTALRRRAYCPYLKDAEPHVEGLTTKKDYDAQGNSTIDKVMNERLIEFLGEGKRWFDLVRFAERNAQIKDGAFKGVEGLDERESTEECPIVDGARGVWYMLKTYLSVSQSSFYTTLINRTNNRYGLYCPIYEMEVKASKGLVPQNPIWNKSKYDK